MALIILALSIIVIQACEGQGNKISDLSKKDSLTFVRDVVLNKRGEPGLSYSVSRQVENKLNLPAIAEGFDSIQLRITFSYSGEDSCQTVVITHHDEKWNAKIYRYLFGNNDSANKNTPINVVDTYPRSGWDTFISRVYGLEILTLPDMDKINNGKFEIYEGDAVTVEYATQSKYRLYQYNTPFKFQKIWKEAKQMEGIIQLVEKEFNFKRVRTPTGKPLEEK